MYPMYMGKDMKQQNQINYLEAVELALIRVHTEPAIFILNKADTQSRFCIVSFLEMPFGIHRCQHFQCQGSE